MPPHNLFAAISFLLDLLGAVLIAVFHAAAFMTTDFHHLLAVARLRSVTITGSPA